MKKALYCILAAALCIFLAGSAQAALKKTSPQGSADPAAACDPHPAETGDIVLPLPDADGGVSSELFLVLRPVAVPAAGLLYDRKFLMGMGETDARSGLYERRVEGYVNAPFRSSDLPRAWRESLPKEQQEGSFFYFLGKYELTNAQWHAVMGGSLPEGARPEQPKTNISWYEVQDFLHRYNTWLLALPPDSAKGFAMPRIDRESPAFLRLPGEEEWEYAARGGSAVPQERAENQEFPLEEGRSIEDYAVFGADYTQAAPVGTKYPNPLGMYDMAGNAAEMVGSSFRFTIADTEGGRAVRRMHGAQGGFLSKGGSFLATDERDVCPGRRVEMRMFVPSQGGSFVPFSSRSTGVRLALSSINVPGMEREKLLETEAARIRGTEESDVPPTAQKTETPSAAVPEGRDARVTLDPAGNPLAELDKVMRAAASPFMKSNLAQLKDLLEDHVSAARRERDSGVMWSVRSTVYAAEALRNWAFRCYFIDYTIQEVKNKPGISEKKVEEWYSTLRSALGNLTTATNYYTSCVRELSGKDAALVNAKIAALKSEYSGKDQMSEHMRQNLDKLEKHLADVRAGGVERLKLKRVWKDLVASVHMKVIEKALGRKK